MQGWTRKGLGNMRERRTAVGGHNDITAAQRAECLARTLHGDHAANAEYMAAAEAHRLISDAEAHRAEVVVELWHGCEHLRRQLVADGLGHFAHQKWLAGEQRRKPMLDAQRSALVKLYTTFSSLPPVRPSTRNEDSFPFQLMD